MYDTLTILGCARCVNGDYLDRTKDPCPDAYTTRAKECGCNMILGERERNRLERYFKGEN